MAAEWVLLLEGVMALAMLAMSFSQPFPRQVGEPVRSCCSLSC